MCIVCDLKLKNCNKSALLRHKSTTKHIKLFETKKNTVTIQQFFNKPGEKPQNKIAKAELFLTGYIAEHGVPFEQVNLLVEVTKMFPDREIAQGIKLKKRKKKKTNASYIIQDGIR